MKKILLFLLPLFISSVSSCSNAPGPLTDTEKDVILVTGKDTLYGTLRTPAGGSPIVALIIAGSGPTDRNGNNPYMKNNSLEMLADSLSAKGIASLRYDKRGIAKSRNAGKHEHDLRFEDYVNDAANWARWLKTAQHFSKVVIIGHSEGSLIGMIAAQQNVADGYISVAGAGRPADVLITEQLKSQSDTVQKTSREIMDSLLMGDTVKRVNFSLLSLFRASVQPYLISWFKYDPAKEIAKVKIPALIIQGSTDIQVSVTDAQLLAKAQPAATLVIIDGMNHIFKSVPVDKDENIKTYKDPTLPIIAQLPDDINKFIREKISP